MHRRDEKRERERGRAREIKDRFDEIELDLMKENAMIDRSIEKEMREREREIDR